MNRTFPRERKENEFPLVTFGRAGITEWKATHINPLEEVLAPREPSDEQQRIDLLINFTRLFLNEVKDLLYNGIEHLSTEEVARYRELAVHEPNGRIA